MYIHTYELWRILLSFLKKQMTAELFKTVRRILLTMSVIKAVDFISAVICNLLVGIVLRWVSPILDIQINLSKECGQNKCIWGQISTNLFKTTFRYNFVAGYFWEKIRIFNCNKPIWSEKILLNILSL